MTRTILLILLLLTGCVTKTTTVPAPVVTETGNHHEGTNVVALPPMPPGMADRLALPSAIIIIPTSWPQITVPLPTSWLDTSSITNVTLQESSDMTDWTDIETRPVSTISNVWYTGDTTQNQMMFYRFIGE